MKSIRLYRHFMTQKRDIGNEKAQQAKTD